MNKLAEKKYWDSVYKEMSHVKNTNMSFLSRSKNYIKNITRDYSNFVMWEVLFKKYLPKSANMKILEVGCAPGKYLINFKKQFGYEPYGIEYSEKGVAIVRDNFRAHNIPEDRVIEVDFFDDSFLDTYRSKFDVVFSRGFIEHYDDVKSVVQRHVDLTSPGGYVVVSIPNLAGVNKPLSKLFNVDSYLLHNTSIMNKKEFLELFPASTMDAIYCDYVGVFSIGLFNTNKKWKYCLYRLGLLMQRPFDLLLRIFIPSGNVYSKYSSPYLLYIGKKR